MRRVADAVHVRGFAALGFAHEDYFGHSSSRAGAQQQYRSCSRSERWSIASCAFAVKAGTTLDLSDLLSPHYRTLLFYPCTDAVELNSGARRVKTRGRSSSSCPDGTWRQARKIHSRHPELRDVPRVKISTPNHSTFQLRAQSRPEGMATLQAIASALGIIEGDPVAAQLMKLYRARLDRTLSARGLLRPS